MKSMNTAVSNGLVSRLSSHRRMVALGDTNFTDVAAVIITAADSRSGILVLSKRTGFHLPVLPYSGHAAGLPAGVTAVINGNEQQWLELELAARQYREDLLLPFYNTLTQYVEMGNSTFTCPGHQHGAFSKKHPVRRHFYDFFSGNVFRVDMCNADVELGDLFTYEGSTKDAQKFVAKVFHVDKTYFALNGTSAANKVVTNALLTRGGLVFSDRNNHKSNHHSALIQTETTLVYLEASHNPFGFIGDIDVHCLNEGCLCQQIRDVAPGKADLPRLYRLVIIQLGTYDGTAHNACQVTDTVGHLCGYILLDSTWVGCEQSIPTTTDSSPLLLELNESDPGISMIQLVHKRQAGPSQTLQVHKKDNHIRGQVCSCPYKRSNNAFTLHISTSPFYPLFAIPDISAKIHEGESGRQSRAECAETGIEVCKTTLACCKLLCPPTSLVVDGKLWQGYPTSVLVSDHRFFSFGPGAKWHGSEGYVADQYFTDPCKLLLTTPSIDAETGKYGDFGVPTMTPAHCLRENGTVPEKCDLNLILFLLTPTESHEKLAQLVAMLVQFEQHTEDDSPLAEVLLSVYNKYPVRYRDHTPRQLRQEIYDLYISFDVKDL